MDRKSLVRGWFRPGALNALAVALLIGSRPALALEPASLVEGFARGQLLIETGGRCLLIDLWLARTEQQKEQGLMYVTQLGDGEGMYFGYERPVGVVMWMKNTLIPLDMLFIAADGRVIGVHANAKPLSTDHIRAPGAVVGVLELPGGYAARWGIAAGARVRPAG